MTKTPRRRIDYSALADFRYEIRRFLNFSETAARVAGIEPHQHQALLAIKGLPARQIATVGVLAERLHIQHHSAVELTDRLQAKGLIRRSRGQQDRREVVLQVTLRGELSLIHIWHGKSRQHQLDAEFSGPRSDGKSCCAIALARPAGTN